MTLHSLEKFMKRKIIIEIFVLSLLVIIATLAILSGDKIINLQEEITLKDQQLEKLERLLEDCKQKNKTDHHADALEAYGE